MFTGISGSNTFETASTSAGCNFSVLSGSGRKRAFGWCRLRALGGSEVSGDGAGASASGMMRSVMSRYSVETTSCSAFMAAFIVCHARLAHFTRIGYSRTPESTASLPSASISTSEVAGAVSIV